jgi:hypothetical protein
MDKVRAGLIKRIEELENKYVREIVIVQLVGFSDQVMYVDGYRKSFGNNSILNVILDDLGINYQLVSLRIDYKTWEGFPLKLEDLAGLED